jgi:hypothetical protein
VSRVKENRSTHGEEEKMNVNVDGKHGANEQQDADCAFCDLFLTVAGDGKVDKKDAELFSAHLNSGDHPRKVDSLAESGYDHF